MTFFVLALLSIRDARVRRAEQRAAEREAWRDFARLVAEHHARGADRFR